MSGERAYEIFQREKPDLIITDWLLEGMDGITLTDKIRTDPRSQNPYIPIIITTGYRSIPRVETARDTGITEYLVKPFTSKDLYARIVQTIEKPRKFVESGNFFGPDRRRRKNTDYQGGKKRTSDGRSDEDFQILVDLRDNLSEI